MADTGYSGTPLAQKLGLKDGQRVLFVDLPESLAVLAEARDYLHLGRIDRAGLEAAGGGYDLIHVFVSARAVLEAMAPVLMGAITRAGTVWVSWPKKASKVATDVTEDVIREIVLPLGLVDIKVAAVDETWSGLKLMIRKELR